MTDLLKPVRLRVHLLQLCTRLLLRRLRCLERDAEQSTFGRWQAMCLSWVAVVAGFLGGSVVAWGIGFVVTHFIMQPVISVRTDDGSYGPVLFYETPTESHPARYLRLRVENTELLDAQGLLRLRNEHEEAHRHWPARASERGHRSGWAHRNNDKDNTRDIPRGAHFYMDVVTLDLRPGQPSELRLSHMSPTTLPDFFKDKGTYELELLVAADNASPRRDLRVRFDFDPAKDDLHLTPLDATLMPRWCRRRP